MNSQRPSLVNALAILLLSSPTQAFETKTRLYTESTYLSRIQDVVHQGKLEVWTPAPWNLSPYLDAIWSQDTRTTEKEIYNDNYSGGAGGVRLGIPVLLSSVFAEQRYVRSKQDRTPHDSRLGYVFSYWAEPGFFFTETYGEAVFSSRIENDIFGEVWSKAGHRWRPRFNWNIDCYGETDVRRDRLGYFYENYQELRAGVRSRYDIGSFYGSLSVHYGLGEYEGREYKDPNPYGRQYAGWRALLVVGGDQ